MMWSTIKADLSRQMARATYEHLLSNSSALVDGDCWLIRCGSASQRDWLEHRLEGLVRGTIEARVEHPVSLRFESPPCAKVEFFRRAFAELALSPAQAAERLRASGFAHFDERLISPMWAALTD